LPVRLDFKPPLSILEDFHLDADRRFWILYPVADEDICDIGNELRQIATEVKIAFPMSHNTLTIVEEYVK